MKKPYLTILLEVANFFQILLVSDCLLGSTVTLNLFLRTTSIGKGWASRIVILAIMYTRWFASVTYIEKVWLLEIVNKQENCN